MAEPRLPGYPGYPEAPVRAAADGYHFSYPKRPKNMAMDLMAGKFRSKNGKNGAVSGKIIKLNG